MNNGGSILIGGRFEIDNPAAARLGDGGMGAVYLGLDTLTGEDVAIKALNQSAPLTTDEMIARLIREGQALRLLAHPNIIKVIATIHETRPGNGAKDAYYLVMEYAGGGSLSNLLARQGRLSCRRALEIALDLSDALAHAHHLGIVHRDVKPGNVLLSDSDAPLLSDFGLALQIDRSNMSQPDVLAGTIAYLSPEACRGQSLDQLSDIWSFGVLLWELLTGRQLFARETIAATLAAIISKPAPDLREACPDAPDRLAQLLAFILEKDRRLRLPSMRLVGAELEAILAAIQSGPDRLNNGAWGLGFRPLSPEQVAKSFSTRG